MKTTPIKSNLQRGAYKEVVPSLEVKSLEVFVTKVVKVSLFHVDLRQTLLDDMSSIRSVPPIFEQSVEVQSRQCNEPTSCYPIE